LQGPHLPGGPAAGLACAVDGAPGRDAAALRSRLRVWGPWAQDALTGVEVAGVTFTPRAPTDGKYDDVEVRGIRLRVTDRRRYDPTRAAILMLGAMRAAQSDSRRFDDPRFAGLAR